MRVIIENLPKMTGFKQQEIGTALRVTLAYHKINIDGVTVQFEEES